MVVVTVVATVLVKLLVLLGVSSRLVTALVVVKIRAS
jgi:hypothetical protein